MIAPIGGDEFAVLATGADAHAAQHLAERIETVCEPRARYSVGIATAPEHGLDYDSLYRAADKALYEDKRHSRRQIDQPLEPRAAPYWVVADAQLQALRR